VFCDEFSLQASCVCLQAAPFHPSMFGNTLEDAMELQKEKFPNSELPWIVTTLCEKMLVLGALETEGVFR
jgi:hypothetical protein